MDYFLSITVLEPYFMNAFNLRYPSHSSFFKCHMIDYSLSKKDICKFLYPSKREINKIFFLKNFFFSPLNIFCITPATTNLMVTNLIQKLFMHCCTGSTILNFTVYIMPWHFWNTNSIKNEKDHVINIWLSR